MFISPEPETPRFVPVYPCPCDSFSQKSLSTFQSYPWEHMCKASPWKSPKPVRKVRKGAMVLCTRFTSQIPDQNHNVERSNIPRLQESEIEISHTGSWLQQIANFDKNVGKRHFWTGGACVRVSGIFVPVHPRPCDSFSQKSLSSLPIISLQTRVQSFTLKIAKTTWQS